MSEPRNRTEKPLLFRKRAATPKKEDQRVRRTRDRLGDALISLLLEQPFDEITVQQVLELAGVSRSTFYAHYRDKNDLFLSDVEEFFESMATALSRLNGRSERLAPVHELFAHVQEARPFYDALVSSGRVHEVMELGQEHFARGIERRLGEIAGARSLPLAQRPAAARSLAGSLFSLLTWWLQHGMTPSPEKMDQLYHRLAWTGLGHP